MCLFSSFSMPIISLSMILRNSFRLGKWFLSLMFSSFVKISVHTCFFRYLVREGKFLAIKKEKEKFLNSPRELLLDFPVIFHFLDDLHILAKQHHVDSARQTEHISLKRPENQESIKNPKFWILEAFFLPWSSLQHFYTSKSVRLNNLKSKNQWNIELKVKVPAFTFLNSVPFSNKFISIAHPKSIKRKLGEFESTDGL